MSNDKKYSTLRGSNNCKNCRYTYKSYHCRDCDSYDGDYNELETFCRYCNHIKGGDSCNNCVWF